MRGRARLTEREKQVLQTAAVIGKEFSEPVLVQVLAGVAPHDARPADLAAALRTLARAEFVYEQALYPVAEYTFKRPLTQQVAYDTLLRERRARMHAAVARATAAIYAEKLDEKAALLAHHCEHAGEARRAALWHKRAAEWAGTTNAAERVRHWERVRSTRTPGSAFGPKQDTIISRTTHAPGACQRVVNGSRGFPLFPNGNTLTPERPYARRSAVPQTHHDRCARRRGLFRAHGSR